MKIVANVYRDESYKEDCSVELGEDCIFNIVYDNDLSISEKVRCDKLLYNLSKLAMVDNVDKDKIDYLITYFKQLDVEEYIFFDLLTYQAAISRESSLKNKAFYGGMCDATGDAEYRHTR